MKSALIAFEGSVPTFQLFDLIVRPGLLAVGTGLFLPLPTLAS